MYICRCSLSNFIMKSRTSYTAEQKLAIVREVMSRKVSIQKVAAREQIAATLISLWKKQAEDAMVERFQPKPKGRRKAEMPAENAEQMQKIKNESRKIKIKASHLESSLKESKKRVAMLEAKLGDVCAVLGYKLLKVRRARKEKAAKKG